MMQRPAAAPKPQLLLLLLLLLPSASVLSAKPREAWNSDELLMYDGPDLQEDVESKSSPFASREAAAQQLRELLSSEIRRRRSRGGDDAADAGVAVVFGGASRVGKAMNKDLKGKRKKKKKKEEEEKKKKNWFVRLWQRLRRRVSLKLLIAGGGSLLLLLLLLVACCCYCCCCRKSDSDLRRGEPPPQTVMYKDISLTGEKPPYGSINYSLEYDLNKSSLIVTVSNCQNLPKGLDSLDPYVVVTLTDEADSNKEPKSKTSKVARNSSNPVFNFGCSFPVKKRAQLRSKVVTFEIYDWDLGTRHDMIARKVIHLRKLGEALDDILGRNVEFSKHLNKGLEQELKGPGDVCVSLYYAAKEKSLTVTIVECKAVFVGNSKDKPDLDTLPNTYVQLTFCVEGHKKEQVKKTSLAKGSRNPYFNQEFVFAVGGAELLESSWMRVSLFHKTETLRIKRLIGVVEFGTRAEPDTLQHLHWQELMRTPNHAIARWHNFLTPRQLQQRLKDKEKMEQRRLQEQLEEQEMERAVAESEMQN